MLFPIKNRTCYSYNQDKTIAEKYKNMKIKLLTAAILLAFASYSQTHLSGDIGNMTFDATGNPYIIKKNIFIPEGTLTTLKSGVVFLFHSFTGLNVSGSFLVEGSQDNPVIFTSINNFTFNKKAEKMAEPFDWNGIDIKNSAKTVKLRNFTVSYSVYGIKSKKQDIVLINSVFGQNGQFNLTIDDNILMVKDMISYSYNAKNDEDTNLKKQKIVLPPKQRKLRNSSLITLGTGVAGGILSTAFYVKYSQYKNKYETATDVSAMDEYFDKEESYKYACIGSLVFTGVSCAASAILYTFYRNTSKKTPETDIKFSGYYSNKYPSLVVYINLSIPF